MIEVDEEYPIGYIDQSGLCNFARCPAKYLFSRLMGLRMPDSSMIALDYGSDMHAAFPHCYGDDISCVEKATSVFKQSWETRPYGEGDSKRNTLNARASLAEFQRTHKPSACPYKFVEFAKEIRAQTAEVISDNELPFLVDIGADLVFAGRIDAVVRMKGSDDLWALDYKTTSEISQRYFDNFANHPQIVGYSRALSLVMSEKVEGLIIEASRVSAKRVETQWNNIFVNQQQIKMFEDYAKQIASDILLCNTNKTWPQKSTGCATYAMFGQPGRSCEYTDLCLIGDWREMAKYYSKSEPFHPFKISR